MVFKDRKVQGVRLRVGFNVNPTNPQEAWLQKRFLRVLRFRVLRLGFTGIKASRRKDYHLTMLQACSKIEFPSGYCWKGGVYPKPQASHR